MQYKRGGKNVKKVCAKNFLPWNRASLPALVCLVIIYFYYKKGPCIYQALLHFLCCALYNDFSLKSQVINAKHVLLMFLKFINENSSGATCMASRIYGASCVIYTRLILKDMGYYIDTDPHHSLTEHFVQVRSSRYVLRNLSGYQAICFIVFVDYLKRLINGLHMRLL